MEIITNNIPTIITILSFVLMVYFYFRSNRVIKLNLYYKHNIEIQKISSKNRKIKVLYSKMNSKSLTLVEDEVERVTTTKFWLWNSGKKPLKNEDIAEDKPVIIKFKNDDSPEPIKILDFNINKVSKNCSNLNLITEDEPENLILLFNYIDIKHGAYFEVQHNGNQSPIIEFEPTILGPKSPTKLKNIKGNTLKYKFGDIIKNEKVRSLSFFPLLFIFILILDIFKENGFPENFVSQLLVIISVTFVVLLSGYKDLYSRIPNSLLEDK